MAGQSHDLAAREETPSVQTPTRSVVITGATGGLGTATVQRLAGAGWQVFAADIDSPALHSLASERIVPLPVDVTDGACVDALRNRVAAHTSALAGVVNFAGVLEVGPLVELDEAAFRRVLDVNVVGTFLVMKALFPLVRAGHGRLVLISSETGWQTAMPFNGPYAMSKHAVEAYGDALRRELMLLGIPVIKIQPGAFRTGMVAGAAGRFETLAANSVDFGKQLAKATNWLPREERRAKDPAELASLIERALTERRWRAAYSINANPASSMLTRLPSRVVDRLLLLALRRD